MGSVWNTTFRYASNTNTLGREILFFLSTQTLVLMNDLVKTAAFLARKHWLLCVVLVKTLFALILLIRLFTWKLQSEKKTENPMLLQWHHDYKRETGMWGGIRDVAEQTGNRYISRTLPATWYWPKALWGFLQTICIKRYRMAHHLCSNTKSSK